MVNDDNRPIPSRPRRRVELDSVSLGRIVFTRHALPTVRPVNHVLDHGDIVIRTHDGSAVGGEGHGSHDPYPPRPGHRRPAHADGRSAHGDEDDGAV